MIGQWIDAAVNEHARRFDPTPPRQRCEVILRLDDLVRVEQRADAADGIFVVTDIRSGYDDFVAAAEVERGANRIDRSSEVTLPRTSRNVPADPAKAPVVLVE